MARRRVVATLALGLAFLGLQAYEFATLARHGIGFSTDRAASCFFAVTGWHGLHVLVGVILLAVVAIARRGEAPRLVALFWQFLDAVWIVLFVLFYLAPRAHGVGLVALGLAAAAGFAAVVAFPMRLRREPRAVKLVFMLPLALPILFTVALVADALQQGIRP